ncbi:RNI-like protein [Meredithblackwellia eburnea MCA 4105]
MSRNNTAKQAKMSAPQPIASTSSAIPRRFHASAPPLGPSRSPSSTSASDADASMDNEEESADDSDFLDPDDSLQDISTSSSTIALVPALATPKPNGGDAPWPFTSASQSSPTHRGSLSELLPLDLRHPGSPVLASFHQPPIPASSLPHEILLHILRLLPASSLFPAILVCKAWCQCGVELLWHKPSSPTLSSLTLLLSVITRLHGEEPTTFPYHLFIKRLNFTQLQNEMNDGILRMLGSCERLERLTLTGCKDISSRAMVDLIRRCERLVALDLSDVAEADDAVIQAVAERCKRLQGLNLSGCKKVTDVGVEAIALNCPGLRRIKLRNVQQLTDTSIILLALHCPLLLEVDLIFCVNITSLSLLQLLRSSTHLRELSLQACTAITDTGFPPVNAVSRRSSSPGDPLPPLVSAATGREIPQPILLTAPPHIRNFDHLRYLDLTSLEFITDIAISGIVRHCPRIRNLVLAKCSLLTDKSVEAVCALGKHLHYLHMGHMSHITDAAVLKLARSCTRLRYIDLACCNNLTDMAVFELAAYLPRLKRIGLVRVNALTDAAIYALFSRTSLERIHLSYCENLSVQAIHELLQALQKLTHLSLTGVPSFRRADLQKFCRPPPTEFNNNQRQSFCVFSGKGVVELRNHLKLLAEEANPTLSLDEAGASRSRTNRQRIPAAAAAALALHQHQHQHQLQLQPGHQHHHRHAQQQAGSAPVQFPPAHTRHVPVQFVANPPGAGTGRGAAPPAAPGGSRGVAQMGAAARALTGNWRWNPVMNTGAFSATMNFPQPVAPNSVGLQPSSSNASSAGPSRPSRRASSSSVPDQMIVDDDDDDNAPPLASTSTPPVIANGSTHSRPRRSTVTRATYRSRAADEDGDEMDEESADSDVDEDMA